ncbi:hypothetical protein RZE82_01460 [Mollicutes bacterium LVI A0039]|nr:hypothetical protein RZE82_01460 [Mollicutes bacterium LVI A0039]
MTNEKNWETVSFSSVVEYQRQYFTKLYNVTNFASGYYTTSNDPEYFNANSIIGVEKSATLSSDIYELLAQGVETAKIQVPSGVLNFADEYDQISLISYEYQQSPISDEIEIHLVTEQNYLEYLKLSCALQVQEYGKEYKQDANATYLNQQQYQMYIINYQGINVGEFTYIPQLQAVESIIILSEYQRQGVMSQCFEVITKQLSPKIFMSSDKSSIGFYQKLNCQIIDSIDVNYLYGNNRNLLMYLSLSI